MRISEVASNANSGVSGNGLTRPWPHAQEIQFDKYTVAGNTFLIIDEYRTGLLGHAARSEFTRWALDRYFGVGGADNVLFIAQEPGRQDPRTFRFRIFDWDGTETLSCGNGLLAVAHAISRDDRAGDGGWIVLTELPSGQPNPVRVGVTSGGTRAWADMGLPRRVPPSLYRHYSGDVSSGDVAILRLLLPGAETTEIVGHLVFTGEPHLVFVMDHGFPGSLRGSLFPAVENGETVELMDNIGRQLNVRYRARFPQGVHVSIVDAGHGALRYRTWERIIDTETLACGTGALACAHICLMLGLIGSNATIEMRPQRGLWHDRDARLLVTIAPSGLILAGKPVLICRGSVPNAGGVEVRGSHPAELHVIRGEENGRHPNP